MKITDIRIRLIKKEEGRLKGVASVVLDECFAVHDIKIIDGTEGYFVAMPTRKTNDGEYKDIAHPLNTPTRSMFVDAILDAFKAELAKEQ